MGADHVLTTLVTATELALRINLNDVEEAKSFRDVAPTCAHMMTVTTTAAAAAAAAHSYYEEVDPSKTDEIQDDFELEDSSGADSRPSFTLLRTIDKISTDQANRRKVIDLAWVGSWSLRQKTLSLKEAMTAEDIWLTIGQCLSAKRMVIKTATAIELAAAALEGVPSRLAHLYKTEVHRSLCTRKLYARFRSMMRPDCPPDIADVEARLRMTAVSFAWMVGHNAYDDMKIQDRQLLRGLQGKSLRWLSARKADSPEATPRLGLRIWQESAAFAQCLMMVNNRSELREHDHELSTELLSEFATTAPLLHEEEARLRKRLAPLAGRDEDLDRILERDDALDREDITTILKRIANL